MKSAASASEVRFYPHQMYCGDSTPPRSASHLVHDARFGHCLVWRPVEGPPLPRRHATRAPSPSPPSAAPTQSPSPPYAHADENDTVQPQPTAFCHGPLRARDGDVVTLTGASPPVAQSVVVPRVQPDTASPARGQLLRRGKGGIDDVLKNAREAQNLFYSLQERRLKAEYRSTQHELKHELDQQREYKRMLELSAYQEELVNLYGPSMRDIIADVFFDDGHDPVLALLKAKREAPLSHEGAAYIASAHQRESKGAARQLWQRSESTAAPMQLREAAEGRQERASRERELLHRALDERRGGRRTFY